MKTVRWIPFVTLLAGTGFFLNATAPLPAAQQEKPKAPKAPSRSYHVYVSGIT